jgi:glycosyltransferase involved in cell wall biosynthesis
MDAAELVIPGKVQAKSRPYVDTAVDLSIVVPVGERHDDLRQLYLRYSEAIRHAGYSCEFIFVVDGSEGKSHTPKLFSENGSRVRVITLNRSFGEATALSVGFANAKSPVVITLPAYFQVEPREIQQVITALLSQDVDLVISRRSPDLDSLFNRVRAWAFHRLVCMVSGRSYHDLACRLRAMKRKVAEEVSLYGDLHYFFPVLAYQRGFKIAEVPVRPSRQDAGRRTFQPGGYLRILLDLFNLLFLVKFTRKPLRFFGSAGMGLFVSGAVITAYLGAYRLLDFGGISHRPLLVLGVLLMVVGVQLFSIGLLGELIIFTHARHVKDYEIGEVLDQ